MVSVASVLCRTYPLWYTLPLEVHFGTSKGVAKTPVEERRERVRILEGETPRVNKSLRVSDRGNTCKPNKSYRCLFVLHKVHHSVVNLNIIYPYHLPNMMWIHFTATATTFVLCCHCFVQGFSVIGHYQRPHFADSNLRTKGGVGVAGRYTSSSRRVTTEQQPSIARESKAATRGGGSSGASTVGGNKMVLRPDWEREGRVFGLSPQSLQDTQRAARLAEGLLKQKQEAKGKPAERAFEYLVSYPCEFEIKVIGINEGSFADDIAATVSSACQVCDEAYSQYLWVT